MVGTSMSIFIPKKLVLKFYTNSADKIQSTWQVDKSILPHANQTIFNIIRWLAGSMGQRTVELGFLGDFVLLLFKTCSLDHEKLFIKKVNDICSQVFNNFFSASDIMEAVRGRFCFYRYECKVAWYKLDCCKVCMLRINKNKHYNDSLEERPLISSFLDFLH